MDASDIQSYSLDHPLITMIFYVGNQVEEELDDNLQSIGLSVARRGLVQLQPKPLAKKEQT